MSADYLNSQPRCPNEYRYLNSRNNSVNFYEKISYVGRKTPQAFWSESQQSAFAIIFVRAVFWHLNYFQHKKKTPNWWRLVKKCEYPVHMQQACEEKCGKKERCWNTSLPHGCFRENWPDAWSKRQAPVTGRQIFNEIFLLAGQEAATPRP